MVAFYGNNKKKIGARLLINEETDVRTNKQAERRTDKKGKKTL